MRGCGRWADRGPGSRFYQHAQPPKQSTSVIPILESVGGEDAPGRPRRGAQEKVVDGESIGIVDERHMSVASS